ncbi:arsenate reductase ArsC [Candidatus Omnitrophota bacterium]
MRKQKVLFVCTHNACRSQIAEGLLNSLYGERYEAYSAGTAPSRVNPYSIKVMAEIGLDISRHISKSLKVFEGKEFDFIVTVCDSAGKGCPVFPGASKRLHWGLPDPSKVNGSEEEILDVFRKVRDEIKENIIEVFK